MSKYADIEYWYEQWGGGGNGLSEAISNIRMDYLNQTGHLDKLFKIAEQEAYKGDVDGLRETLAQAYDTAAFTEDKEWIDALLDFIFNLEQYA